MHVSRNIHRTEGMSILGCVPNTRGGVHFGVHVINEITQYRMFKNSLKICSCRGFRNVTASSMSLDIAVPVHSTGWGHRSVCVAEKENQSLLPQSSYRDRQEPG